LKIKASSRFHFSCEGYILLARLKGQNDALCHTLGALTALRAIITTSGAVVESIDVNPFLNREQCVAVDALIVPRRHLALTR
jgi:hypothetical protein